MLPEWGEHRIADVGHGEIQRWVATLMADSSPSTVHKIHRTLSLVLKLAVKDGRLVRNPAAASTCRASWPASMSTSPTITSRARAAVRAAPLRTVLFFGYARVWYGEMAPLRVRQLDLQRHRATIAVDDTSASGAHDARAAMPVRA